MKKTLKKLVTLGLAVVVVAAMVTGCAGNGDKGSKSKEEKVELVMSVWDSDQEPVMKEMGEAYTKLHPNITIKTQLTTWNEYWTKLEAGVTGGAAPDIITMNVLHVEDYADAGVLMDLTEAESKSDLKVHDNFPEPLVEGYTVDGKLYAVPKDFDTNAVFYNKEIFDNAGVAYPGDNWTFDDFRKKCEELKAAGLPNGAFPTAINRNSGQTTYNAAVFANGGYFLSEGNKESGWADPKTIAGVQPWVDMVQDGLSPSLKQMADTDPDAMFQGGQLAMYLSGNYMIMSYNKTLEGKYGIAKRPAFNGKDTDIINGLGFSVSAVTKYPEEAQDFALWMGGKEAQTIQGKSGTVISARNDCQELFLDTHKDLKLQVFLDNVPNTYLLPHCKSTAELGKVEKVYLDQVWEGKMELKDAGEKIKKEQDIILDKMNAK